MDSFRAYVKELMGTPAPVPTPTPTPSTNYKVGDIVDFTGTIHRTNANAASGKSCKPGKAKITQIYSTGKYPYHLIAEKGGGSTVYGWVSASDIKGATTPVTPSPTPPKIEKGSKVKIKPGAKYYGGQNIPAWVMSDTWIVLQVTGDRAVLDKNVSGKNSIMSPININNLVLA